MRTKIIICRAHIRAVTDVLESWRKNHDEATEVHDLEDLIRLCLTLSDELDRLTAEAQDALAGGRIDNLQGRGFMIQGTLDASVQTMNAVVESVERSRVQGHSVASEAALREAERKTRQLQSTFLGRWPFFSAEEIEQARTEIERGRFVTGEDLDRELHGEGSVAR